jgi:hypothetical protein
MLFHLSEESRIEKFDPRMPENGGESIVWAIDSLRLRNYLVPRECPRVTYYAGSETNSADVARFLGRSSAVVAVESDWFERLRSCRLYCYHLPPESFECIDEGAGYFVSRVPVIPIDIEVIEDPIAELLRREVELRFVPQLWPLHDAVLESTLQFSMIRMRNARPRALG